MLKKLSIDELLDLCRQNNSQAQMEVYNRYHLAQFHTALRIVRHRVDAEDIMQEAFLTAFNKLDQYKGENKFGGWLKQITLRKALNHVTKKEKYIPQEEFWGLEEETNEDSQSNKENIILHHCLQQLNPRYKNILLLKYLEGLDYEEISALLQISYGNCRTLVARAKEKLKQQIQHYERHQ